MSKWTLTLDIDDPEDHDADEVQYFVRQGLSDSQYSSFLDVGGMVIWSSRTHCNEQNERAIRLTRRSKDPSTGLLHFPGTEG